MNYQQNKAINRLKIRQGLSEYISLVSLKDFLNSNSSKNGNIVNKTKEFKSVYKNLSNIDVLKSTGSSGSSSGCVGSSVGSSANSSSTRSSSSGNGSGSFGSGSNSSSSQDFNK